MSFRGNIGFSYAIALTDTTLAQDNSYKMTVTR